jgi:hypothetical protein
MAEAKKVKVRVLADCQYGKVNMVVEIDASAVKGLAGTVDADPDAVAYAETLPQPKPETDD